MTDQENVKGVLDILNNSVKSAKDLSIKEMCHYTTIDALNGIISNGSLRFTNLHFMNDPFDGVFFASHFIDYLEYVLFKDFGYKNINWHSLRNGGASVVLSKLKEVADYPEGEFLYYFYCFLNQKYFTESRFRWRGSQVFAMSFSVTEESQDLPQWRSYANNCKGVRINFDVEKLEDGIKKKNKWISELWSVKQMKVLYLNKDSGTEIFQKILTEMRFLYKKMLGEKFLEICIALDTPIMLLSNFSKNDHFLSENEFRVVFDNIISGIPDIKFNTDGSICAKPYIDVEFNVDSINSIVAGPALDEWQRMSLLMLCSKKIREDIVVKSSNIRFRA